MSKNSKKQNVTSKHCEGPFWDAGVSGSNSKPSRKSANQTKSNPGTDEKPPKNKFRWWRTKIPLSRLERQFRLQIRECVAVNDVHGWEQDGESHIYRLEIEEQYPGLFERTHCEDPEWLEIKDNHSKKSAEATVELIADLALNLHLYVTRERATTVEKIDQILSQAELNSDKRRAVLKLAFHFARLTAVKLAGSAAEAHEREAHERRQGGDAIFGVGVYDTILELADDHWRVSNSLHACLEGLPEDPAE